MEESFEYNSLEVLNQLEKKIISILRLNWKDGFYRKDIGEVINNENN